MQSDKKKIIDNVGWVISNMINHGLDDIIKKVIQADHCIKYYIDAIKRIEREILGNHMIKALTKCIEVDSGLKELYISKNLKEILEKNDHIDKSSEEYKKLLSTLNKRSRKGNEFANKRRRKR